MVILNVQKSVRERRVVNAKMLSLSDQSINLCKINVNSAYLLAVIWKYIKYTS